MVWRKTNRKNIFGTRNVFSLVWFDVKIFFLKSIYAFFTNFEKNWSFCFMLFFDRKPKLGKTFFIHQMWIFYLSTKQMLMEDYLFSYKPYSIKCKIFSTKIIFHERLFFTILCWTKQTLNENGRNKEVDEEAHILPQVAMNIVSGEGRMDYIECNNIPKSSSSHGNCKLCNFMFCSIEY